ncbi:uncharacterized protein LOC108034777 [Drosophila biarmipes]|uniref:uncharacterized protein LOC108034777 n=1 Tax=Drosophila biarmipes TaxID=125945 RepID=UPI0007E7EC96|nr:uncharacterized protein LOC108034777 [Drosophila biarmipes]
MPLSAPLHKLLCVCHIVSFFGYQKKVCHLLCLHNVRYNVDSQKFGFGHQVLIYFVYFWSLLCLLFYFLFLDGFVIDRGSLYIYILPCLYYIHLKKSLLRTLNEMARVHRELQSTMGTLFCVSVKRAFCCSLLICIELLLVIYWQIESLKNDIQRWTVFTCLLGWHLQLLLLVNSYIWLHSIYVVMNQVLTAELRIQQRWKMLRIVLKEHSRLAKIQRDVSHFFSVYISSVVLLISVIFYRSVILEAGIEWELSRLVLLRLETWQIRYLAYIILLIGTFLMVVWDYKSIRDTFLRGLWKTQEICLRTWDSRNTQRCKQTQDIVDMMILTGNAPRDMVCTKLVLWELRIKEATIFTLETAFFMNYFLLLMITVCLIPIVAISNGFEIGFEEKLLNYTYCSKYSEGSEAMNLTIENLTLGTYTLSHALG